MPKFKSVGGVWVPVDEIAKEDLKGVGVQTIGQPSENVNTDTSQDPNIENEEQLEEGSDEQKEGIKKLKKRKGVKSKKKKRKVA